MSSQRDYTPDPLNRAARGLSARLPKLRPERADAAAVRGGARRVGRRGRLPGRGALGLLLHRRAGRRDLLTGLLGGAADSRMLNVAVAAMAGLIRTQRGIAGRSAQPMASEHI